MKTELLSPVTITEESLKKLAKLMLNSWSAEYALRITPLLDGEAYRETSLRWSFPQTYYSALFSFRAVMETLGGHTANSAVLAEHASALYYDGLYDGTNVTPDYLLQLAQLLDPTEMREQMKGLHSLAINDMLVKVVEQINLAHEAHILSAIGWDAYYYIVDNTPAYLRQSFVHERIDLLASREEVPA